MGRIQIDGEEMNLTDSSHSIAWNEIVNLCNLAAYCQENLSFDHKSTAMFLLKCTTFRLIKHVWPQERQDVILRITETFGGK